MRDLSFLEKIARAINEEDEERNKAYEGRPSKPIRLPLVHRTADRNILKSIFSDGYLHPPENASEWETEFNPEPAVFLSWGAAAYPNGDAALIFYPETLAEKNSSFTPFDSGGVQEPHLEPTVPDPDPDRPWSDRKVRKEFLDDHTGDCAEFDEFALHYLHAHFRDIKDYVTLPQNSDPDWPPYHGLRCPEGPDRRAWTIEIQIPAQVPLRKAQTIVLDGEDLAFGEEFGEQLFVDDGLRVIFLKDGNRRGEDSRDPNEGYMNRPDPLQREVSDFIIREYLKTY